MTPVAALWPRALALAAFFCGVLSSVFLKAIADTPSSEAVALRALTALALVSAVILWRPATGAMVIGRIGLLRGALDAVAGLSFALAILSLPLSLLASILATLPILSVALSALILSEPLPPRTWAALSVAFAGTLLILKPGLEFSAMGIALGLVSVLCFALRDIVTRRLPQGADSRQVVLLSLVLVAAAALALGGAQPWVLPGPQDTALILMTGITFVASSFLIVVALRSAPVSRIAPLRYSSVVWALVFDGLIWGYFPGLLAWGGIALIVLAGLMQAWSGRAPG